MFVIYVIFWVIVWGGLAAAIANSKGGDSVFAFVAGAVLGPIGCIIALFMGSEAAKSEKELANRTKKKCTRCAELVQPEAQVCRFCGHEFAMETQWSAVLAPALEEPRGFMIPNEEPIEVPSWLVALVVTMIVVVILIVLLAVFVPSSRMGPS